MKVIVKSILLLLLLSSTAHAQLREFEITPIQNNRIPVFRDHPEMAAVIVNSSLTNLRFDSNLDIVAMLGNPNQGEYILIIRPVRQILAVNATGYQQGRITVSLTEPRQVAYYRIEPKPEVATNIVPANFQITPTDALVSIDGTRVDASKPVSIEIGSHMLKVEKQGYRTIEKEIRVSTEQNLFRESMVAIEPVPFTIKTQPAGASILLDGVQVGVTDRNGDLGLFRFPGTYELGVQLSGFVPEARTITVAESGANAFTTTLVRNAGTLRVNVTPIGATVLVNRQAVDIAQPLELAPGMVRIEVSKEAHEPFAETVEILRSQTTTRTITLVAHVGGFQITPTPLQASWTLSDASGRVVISGTGLGRKTDIPVGIYFLVVKARGYQEHNETIRLERNKIFERVIFMRETNSSNQLSRMSTGNQKKTRFNIQRNNGEYGLYLASGAGFGKLTDLFINDRFNYSFINSNGISQTSESNFSVEMQDIYYYPSLGIGGYITEYIDVSFLYGWHRISINNPSGFSSKSSSYADIRNTNLRVLYYYPTITYYSSFAIGLSYENFWISSYNNFALTESGKYEVINTDNIYNKSRFDLVLDFSLSLDDKIRLIGGEYGHKRAVPPIRIGINVKYPLDAIKNEKRMEHWSMFEANIKFGLPSLMF